MKPFGILPLLDEECRMPIPKTESFMQKVISKHENCSEFFLNSSNKTASDSTLNGQCGFVIRHFGNVVNYSTVRILEKNHFYYLTLKRIDLHKLK